jgi:hypothetical protein
MEVFLLSLILSSHLALGNFCFKEPFPKFLATQFDPIYLDNMDYSDATGAIVAGGYTNDPGVLKNITNAND